MTYIEFSHQCLLPITAVRHMRNSAGEAIRGQRWLPPHSSHGPMLTKGLLPGSPLHPKTLPSDYAPSVPEPPCGTAAGKLRVHMKA